MARRALVPLALTIAALAAGCHDSTAPANEVGGRTQEGIIVSARVSRAAFGPSDTVWGTAVLRNRSPFPVTLKLVYSLGSDMVLTPTVGVWMLPGYGTPLDSAWFGGRLTGSISAKTIPAHDSPTYAFPLTVSGNATAPTGTYTFRAAIYPVDTIAGRVTTVASNTVTATLRD